MVGNGIKTELCDLFVCIYLNFSLILYRRKSCGVSRKRSQGVESLQVCWLHQGRSITRGLLPVFLWPEASESPSCRCHDCFPWENGSHWQSAILCSDLTIGHETHWFPVTYMYDFTCMTYMHELLSLLQRQNPWTMEGRAGALAYRPRGPSDREDTRWVLESGHILVQEEETVNVG